MPTAYVKKLAKKHKVSIDKAEGRWAAAKEQAAKQGHAEDYDYVTGIFKKMMGESVDTAYYVIRIPDKKIMADGISYDKAMELAREEANKQLRKWSDEYPDHEFEIRTRTSKDGYDVESKTRIDRKWKLIQFLALKSDSNLTEHLTEARKAHHFDDLASWKEAAKKAGYTVRGPMGKDKDRYTAFDSQGYAQADFEKDWNVVYTYEDSKVKETVSFKQFMLVEGHMKDLQIKADKLIDDAYNSESGSVLARSVDGGDAPAAYQALKQAVRKHHSEGTTEKQVLAAAMVRLFGGDLKKYS